MGNKYINISIVHYMLIIMGFIIMTIYYFYNLYKLQKKNKIYIPQQQNDNSFLEKRILLQDRDRKVLNDDLHPPERRDQEYSYPDRYVKRLINIPSRGYPDNYSPLGILVRKNDEKVLQLFGRQKYPGSYEWEYYVTGNDAYNFPNKMPLNRKNNNEITDKDKITVEWLDKSKGDFEANIYNFDVPRYDPYVI